MTMTQNIIRESSFAILNVKLMSPTFSLEFIPYPVFFNKDFDPRSR